MNPSILLVVGDPILLQCPAKGGPARIITITVEWDGRTFHLSGTAACYCCAVSRHRVAQDASGRWVPASLGGAAP